MTHRFLQNPRNPLDVCGIMRDFHGPSLKKGDRLVAYSDHRLAQRLFITVTRVAIDRRWADIVVQTWAVQWKKRQILDDRGLPPAAEMYDWTQVDLNEQEIDHMLMLEERGDD